MAINFPNSPSVGNTYDYLGVRYTWFEPSVGLGLWKATTPGSVGIATTGEIDAGTDHIKYITPDSLNGAQVRQQGTLVSSSAAELNTLDGYLGSYQDFNKIIGLTATTNEINSICDGTKPMNIGYEGSSQLSSGGETWTKDVLTLSQTWSVVGPVETNDWLLFNVKLSGTLGNTAGDIYIYLNAINGSIARLGFTSCTEQVYIGSSGQLSRTFQIWARVSSGHNTMTGQLHVKTLGSTVTSGLSRMTITPFRQLG